jgi:hypothetical protein
VQRWLIQVGKAVGFGGAWYDLAEELKAVLLGSAKFYTEGDADPEHKRKRDCVLDFYLPRGSGAENACKRAILEGLSDGDLDKFEWVHYCKGCCRDESDFKSKLVTYVVKVFMGKVIRVYQRRTFVGQAETLTAVALFERFHRLFSRSFVFYSAKTGVPNANLFIPGAASTGVIASGVDLMPPEADLEAEAEGGVEVGTGPSGPSSGPSAKAPQSESLTSYSINYPLPPTDPHCPPGGLVTIYS